MMTAVLDVGHGHGLRTRMTAHRVTRHRGRDSQRGSKSETGTG
jgi:hypothetical protein